MLSLHKCTFLTSSKDVAMSRASLLYIPAVLLVVATSGCGKDETAEQCAASDLVAQCPVGSNPMLGAEATNECGGGGSFEAGPVGSGGSVVGSCAGSAGCEVYCQFDVPCTCGVVSVSRDEIICQECPDQSCGDGRCEGTERLDCEGQIDGCFECPEDCSGSATCGDGDCTVNETGHEPSAGPDLVYCPQDCAAECIPNDISCIGSTVRLCAANGASFTEMDCADAGMVCADGACVTAGVCGNGFCDEGEDDVSCPIDCGRECQPNTMVCEGETLVSCNGDGTMRSETACDDSGLICENGECVSAGVCGNNRCEMGEDEDSCPSDCTIVCGDGVCGAGEMVSCPADCAVCGNDVCEADEIDTCPRTAGCAYPGRGAAPGRS